MITSHSELKNNDFTTKYNVKKSITDIWQDFLENYPDVIAVVDRYSSIKLTYKELYDIIYLFASGLQALGLNKGDHVSLFSENSSKWLIADQGILLAGGVDAVRGSQTPVNELFYIVKHSDSKALIAENFETISKLLPCLENYHLNFIVCLSEEEFSEEIKAKYNIYSFNHVVDIGKKHPLKPINVNKNEIATLVYTSGTTGEPKGVMLSHENILSQLETLTGVLRFLPGETALNTLPPWHVYERTCEYYLLSCGVTLHYTNALNFKADIQRYKPNYLIAVPRIWQAIYSGIQNELKKQTVIRQKFIKFLLKADEFYIKSKRILTNLCADNINCSFIKKIHAFILFCLSYPFHKFSEKFLQKKLQSALGRNFKLGISGGGALAGYLEDFYEAIGVNIIVGYGLTETAPALTIRNPDYNLRKSAGKPLNKTEIKIVNPESNKESGFLETGLVMARGPQVMKGYYKDIEATQKVLSSDGWLNTGDLGWVTPQNDLVLTGRNKDIIALSNGENIEPQPLEDACSSSSYINQIVLVGQDKAYLGALIAPNLDSVQEWAKKQSLNYMDVSDIYKCPKVHNLFKKELKEQIQKRANYRQYEKIQSFKLLEEPFTVENGLLTRTMKLKKAEIQKKYQDLIEEMFKT
ncbi:MAG TPA: AMP-binding protein [Candidatus Gastranaerophilales bacterium]|nr:AMP-binding protein [Candidatus Gastranaerophilales bacterium]